MKYIPFKERTVDYDRPVYVYRNLGHVTKERWSILQDGLVVAHADEVLLAEVESVIRPSGRDKYLESGVRNVHAFLKGMLLKDVPEVMDSADIHYNKGQFQYFQTGEKFDSANYAVLSQRVYVNSNDSGM